MNGLQLPDLHCRRRRHFLVQPLILLVFLFGTLFEMTPASAIVTRHDTGYSRFLASESDYPAVFPLYVHERGKTCAATLISSRWAITAAHCAEETPLMQQVVEQGAYPVVVAGKTLNVDLLVFHPDWPGNPGRQYDPSQVDLVLLRLSDDVTHIEAVSLYEADGELGQVLTFLGWGYSGIGRTGIAVNDGHLRFARNTVTAALEQLYFEFNDPDTPQSRAVEFEGIPGLGDSGGPALLMSDNKHWLAGIAVGELAEDIDGESIASGGRYGARVVYERVSLHIDWIQEVIAANSLAE